MGWLDRRRKKKEDQEKRDREYWAGIERRQQEDSRYDAAYKKVVIFYGSVAEYERFRGHPVEIMDTGERTIAVPCYDNYPYYSKQLRLLIDNGLEAIVNPCGRNGGEVWGLPVRKKDSPPYR